MAQVVERKLGKFEVGSASLPSGSKIYKYNINIMPTKKAFIKLQCLGCKRVNYFTRKSKKIAEKKLELKKFCRWCRKHTAHKETKK